MPRPKNRSKPFPDLPADVWLYIIQLFGNHDPPYTLASLASVNKYLRSLAFPVLFGRLHLSAPHPGCSRLRRYLEKAIQRVRCISASPHVLHAIRRLALVHWRIGPSDDDEDAESIGYIADENDEAGYDSYDADRMRAKLREISKLRHDGYLEIVALLSNLPRPYDLECHDCSFLPEFFSYVFQIPNLRSLHVNDYELLRDNSTKFQLTRITSLLRVFQYTHHHSCKLRVADVVELFVSLIGQLTIFSFPLDMLPHLLADNRLPMTLPNLRKLSIFNDVVSYEQDNHDDLGCIRSFLNLASNLRELRIVGNIHTKTPLVLSNAVVPHLKTLLAPSNIANGMISGRALEKLHIATFKSRHFRKYYTVVSQDIKHVVYNSVFDDPKEELSHLAHVFPNVITMEIVIIDECKRTVKELSDMLSPILPDFHHLNQYTVSAMEPSFSLTLGVVGLVPPESHRWIWVPEDGWRSACSNYEPDDLYRMRFFDPIY